MSLSTHTHSTCAQHGGCRSGSERQERLRAAGQAPQGHRDRELNLRRADLHPGPQGEDVHQGSVGSRTSTALSAAQTRVLSAREDCSYT